MAQKTVANALILELDPVVGENLDRHLGTEQLWFAHDFVPFEQGENYAFLGGRDWDPSQVTLPKIITDACEILLITKDNVAGYHRELVEHFILEDNWAQWLGRWTAEEHLHAIALREYFVVTREIDPTANEQVRFEHVSTKGYRADQYSQVETLVFMAFFERAHAVYSDNLAAKDRRAGAGRTDHPHRPRRSTARGVLRQPRRALPRLHPRRDDRRDRRPRG